MFNGKPLSQGIVAFAPIDIQIGQPASGFIKDGHFTMDTTVSSPGVIVGKYKITVRSFEPVNAASGRGMPTTPPVSLIPEKYNSIATSGLEVEVARGMAPVELNLSDK